MVFRTTQEVPCCFRFKDATSRCLLFMNISALDATLGI